MNLQGAPTEVVEAATAYLEAENEKWPSTLKQLGPGEFPEGRVREVWRSRDFLVQVYDVPGIPYVERLSVNRTTIDPLTGRWQDGISWDDLQALKEQCGRGRFDAVEVYPAQGDEVNVANMRHLWVLRESKVAFAWRKGRLP